MESLDIDYLNTLETENEQLRQNLYDLTHKYDKLLNKPITITDLLIEQVKMKMKIINDTYSGRYNYNRNDYINEFHTIKINAGRGMGHTTAALNFMRDVRGYFEVAYLVPNLSMLHHIRKYNMNINSFVESYNTYIDPATVQGNHFRFEGNYYGTIESLKDGYFPVKLDIIIFDCIDISHRNIIESLTNFYANNYKTIFIFLGCYT